MAAIGIVHRHRARLADPGRAQRAVRRRAADQGRVHGDAARASSSALAYGFAVALLFTLWPLGRAEQVSASVLFRDEVAPERMLPRPWIIADDAAASPAALVGFAMLTSEAKHDRPLLLPRARRRVRGVPRPRHRRHLGGAAPAAPAHARAGAGDRQPRRAGRADALGRAVAGRRAVAAGHGGAGRRLDRARAGGAAADAARPTTSCSTCRRTTTPAIGALVQREVPGAELDEAPMLRGRIVKLGDMPVEEIKAPPEAQWVLNGDRGLSYADDVPRGLEGGRGRVVAGGLRRRAAGLVRGRHRRGSWASRSATRSPSTCSAATSRRASPTCAR